jgi:hypothetical protein
LCLALAGAAPPDGSKQASRLVTATMRASAVANAKTDPWAKAIQSSAVAAAAGWLVKSDRELCELVTSQELPRASYTKAGILYRKKTPGCPNCGERALRFGDSWKRDPQRRPWKLQCASCGEVFPKNDFAAFYATALDEHGFFRRDRGDRSLLVNSEHPNPNDPLHKLYVDDGYGMLDFRGEAHHMVAYYNNAQWGLVRGAVATLARA